MHVYLQPPATVLASALNNTLSHVISRPGDKLQSIIPCAQKCHIDAGVVVGDAFILNDSL